MRTSAEDIKMPNLFIVGAPRSGTTSLYNYLKQHPEVFMSPIKEPHYFARKDIHEFHDKVGYPKIISDFREYISLFKGGKDKKIRGEASVNYLYSKSATCEIYKLIPDAKIIISLRNPIERALSHFKYDLTLGVIFVKSFCEAIKKRPFHLWMGLYYEHVKRYLETFSTQNVKIIIYDDLKNDTLSVMKDICRFLKIDENYVFNIDLSKKYNVSLIPKNLYLHMLATRTRKILKEVVPFNLYSRIREIYKMFFLSEDPNSFDFDVSRCIDFLVDYFKEDVKKLSDLLGRDLSFWLEEQKLKSDKKIAQD
jgi:hypothetical protein